MQIVTDTGTATQLTAHLDGVRSDSELPKRVAGLFPDPFPAYIKIFHAMFEDLPYTGSGATWQDVEGASQEAAWQDSLGLAIPGELVRSGTEEFAATDLPRIWWRELVPGELLDARANWRTLGGAFDGTSWPRRIVGPDEGRLDRASLAALIRCLEDAGVERSCVMLLEEWVALMNGYEERCAPAVGLVVTGQVRDAERFDELFDVTPRWWWAVDHGWFLYTDVDSCVTWVAGPEELIDRIESEPVLETLRADGTATAFPDRRVELGGGVSERRTWWVESGRRDLYAGFAWFMVLSIFAGGTIALAGDSLAAIPIWLSAFVYAVYRLTKGLLGLSSDVRPTRRRG